MKNSLVVLAFALGGALLYSVYLNRANLKASQSLNDSLSKQIELMFVEQKKQVSIDSLKYVNAIDSLSNKIKTIQYLRANERKLLQSQIAKINDISLYSDFSAYNDSLEKCCTMRH